jgi:hypothetical protein
MIRMDDYFAARARFVRDIVTIGGTPSSRITDPVTGIWLTVSVTHADMLPALFRSEWVRRANGHPRSLPTVGV